MTPNDLSPDPEIPDQRGAQLATLDLSRSSTPRLRSTAVSTTFIEAPQDTGGAAMSTNLLHIWNILLKWRWPIAAMTLLGIAAGVGVTVTTTPVYQATTTIQIDNEPPKVQATPNQNSYSYEDPEKYYLTQYELLKSRALAQRVVKNEDLADNAAFLNPPVARLFRRNSPPPPAPSSYADRANAATGMVMGGLDIVPIRASRLVRISYQSADPAMAANIANAVAANYISWNLERRYQ